MLVFLVWARVNSTTATERLLLLIEHGIAISGGYRLSPESHWEILQILISLSYFP